MKEEEELLRIKENLTDVRNSFIYVRKTTLKTIMINTLVNSLAAVINIFAAAAQIKKDNNFLGAVSATFAIFNIGFYLWIIVPLVDKYNFANFMVSRIQMDIEHLKKKEL